MQAAETLDATGATAAKSGGAFIADEPQSLRAHQRVCGRASVNLARRRGATRLTGLHQSGAAKAMLPRVHGADPEVVLLNTAGGLTGGDQLRYELTIDAGTRAVATTQTAERAYESLRSLPPARLDVDIHVGAGGHLVWLPQETILFDGAALHRRTKIELAADATCVACESIVLGRAAMGETVHRLEFRDWREIRRDGRPVSIEPVALSEADLLRRDGAATLGGARAMATVVLVSPDAPGRLAPLRALLVNFAEGVEVAASTWQGRLMVRALAVDAQRLREMLAAIMAHLAGSLPRVWQM